MSAIELGYAKEIWLGDKKVAYVYLGDKVVYPAIIGYEERTDYTDWVYSITTTSGTRTRNWTSYKRAKYGNGTFGEWEQTGSGVNNETGTQSTSEVNTSGWTYAITFDTGYRTQTYQVRYTYTFSGATQYIDSTLQTRRQDATRTISRVNYTGYTYNWIYPVANSTRSRSYNEQATYTFADSVVHTAVSPAVLVETESGGGSYYADSFAFVGHNLSGIYPANGAGSALYAIIQNCILHLLWSGSQITQVELRVYYGSADNGFTVGWAPIGYGVDSIFRLVNNTSTSLVIGMTRGNWIGYNGYNWPIQDLAVTQAAGVIHWGQPVITAFGYPDMPASGGTIGLNSWDWYQPYTWNGVAGSGGTQNSSGIAYFSQGNNGGEYWAGSKGTTASGRTHIYTSTARVDANGVTGLNATANIYQQANSATRTSSGCSGYTYTEYYTWTSGATSSWSQENSTYCGYVAPHFNLTARLNTDWYTVQNKVGQDYVDINFDCGDSFDFLPTRVVGRWNASTRVVSDVINQHHYATGGALQSGTGGFNWVAPAYVTITNRSGGLAFFYWEYSLPEGAGATADIVLSGNYT